MYKNVHLFRPLKVPNMRPIQEENIAAYNPCQQAIACDEGSQEDIAKTIQHNNPKESTIGVKKFFTKN